MSDELIKNVARAILEAQGYNPDVEPDGDGVPWWHDYKPEARAAIHVVVEECVAAMHEAIKTGDSVFEAVRNLAGGE
jgi:hypothetical protein